MDKEDSSRYSCLDQMTSVIEHAVEWYCAPAPSRHGEDKEVCPTRDVFQARLDTFYRETTARGFLTEDEAALLIAITGEIGNNCFDHNLGQWPDQIGCWFSWTASKGEALCAVADRGQGILNSLKRIRPDLRDEAEALKIAFEQRLSGRSPEQRGNGLKFVRSVVNHSERRGLSFFSGSVEIRLGRNPRLEKILPGDIIHQKRGTGTLAVVLWGQK